MKAFFILLLTDLCIGFQSPHGWEIVISLFLEHLGFAHNKHIIIFLFQLFQLLALTIKGLKLKAQRVHASKANPTFYWFLLNLTYDKILRIFYLKLFRKKLESVFFRHLFVSV